MAYTKTTWIDRVVEFANRFTKSNETSSSVTLNADPGTVTEEGTPISATTMNKIETGIKEAHDDIDDLAGAGRTTETVKGNADAQAAHLADTTAQDVGGTGTAITITLQSFTAYTDNYLLTFIAAASNAGAATTININGLGVKSVYKPNTVTAPNFVASKAYTIWYDATGGNFFIKASAEGTAVAGDVLAGVTFSNDDDTGISGTLELTGNAADADVLAAKTYYNTDAKTKRTGTMIDRAGDTAALAIATSVNTLRLRPSAGFRDGVNDWVTRLENNWVPANIREGINMFGKVGTLIEKPPEVVGKYAMYDLIAYNWEANKYNDAWTIAYAVNNNDHIMNRYDLINRTKSSVYNSGDAANDVDHSIGVSGDGNVAYFETKLDDMNHRYVYGSGTINIGTNIILDKVVNYDGSEMIGRGASWTLVKYVHGVGFSTIASDAYTQFAVSDDLTHVFYQLQSNTAHLAKLGTGVIETAFVNMMCALNNGGCIYRDTTDQVIYWLNGTKTVISSGTSARAIASNDSAYIIYTSDYTHGVASSVQEAYIREISTGITELFMKKVSGNITYGINGQFLHNNGVFSIFASYGSLYGTEQFKVIKL